MICDTSGLLSAHIKGQPFHEECLRSLNEAASLVVPSLVFCELDYLATKQQGALLAERILSELSMPEYTIAAFAQDELVECIRIRAQYSDLGVGLTDASVVLAAKHYNAQDILTLDQRHFRAMRGLDGRHFRLLPFDLDE